MANIVCRYRYTCPRAIGYNPIVPLVFPARCSASSSATSNLFHECFCLHTRLARLAAIQLNLAFSLRIRQLRVYSSVRNSCESPDIPSSSAVPEKLDPPEDSNLADIDRRTDPAARTIKSREVRAFQSSLEYPRPSPRCLVNERRVLGF